MNLSLLLTLIGQIATWLTIMLVYFTLVEMKNQRKALQKPDLIIPKSSIYGYSYSFSDENMTSFLIPRFWSNKHLKGDDHIFSNSGPITLHNVGFGVAKNIKLKWVFQYDKTLQQIKDYCYQYSIPIIIQLDGNTLNVTEQGLQPPSDYLVPEFENNHDFLMPASIASEGLISFIPPAFIELVSISIYLRVHYSRSHLNTMSNLEINTPSMKLELYYDDLENSHYSKTFDVSFLNLGYGFPSSDKEWQGQHEMFEASFEFKNASKK